MNKEGHTIPTLGDQPAADSSNLYKDALREMDKITADNEAIIKATRDALTKQQMQTAQKLSNMPSNDGDDEILVLGKEAQLPEPPTQH